MGVHGLTTYVEGNKQFFQDVKLRDSVLIIDGCSLYFRLYFNHSLDQQHGGDYDAFSSLLDQFFSALAACNIQPFVVLDGGRNLQPVTLNHIMYPQSTVKALQLVSNEPKQKTEHPCCMMLN